MAHSLALIQNLGPWEIGAIVLIVLLLFGGKKLPELARGAGKAIKEFRSATAEAEKTFKSALDETDAAETKPKAPAPEDNVSKPLSTGDVPRESVKNDH